MRLNILLIICHDLGRHLACHGDGTVPSPNLDRLAGRGLRFTNFYASSTPCSPARGCLLSGRYAHCQGLMGLAHRGWEYLPGTRTLAHDFSQAGYLTYLVGFQHESRQGEGLGYQRIWRDSVRSDRVGDEVIRFLASPEASARPCFLSVGLQEVHLPFDREYYRADDPSSVALPSFLPDNPHNRRQMALFHGAIRFMDQHVGRMLAGLAQSPLKDNTVVVFTTDHGMAFPRAKSTLYDAGIGTTLIMALPPGAGATGQVRRELLAGIDLRPTLCQLAGVPLDPAAQGRSFAPLLTGGQYRPRQEVFSEKNYHNHYDPIRCVRTERFKYIRNFRDAPNLLLPSDIEETFPPGARRPDGQAPRPKEELYDLSSDPGEERNLIDAPAHAEVLAALRRRLGEWMEQTGDPLLASAIIPYPPEQFGR